MFWWLLLRCVWWFVAVVLIGCLNFWVAWLDCCLFGVGFIVGVLLLCLVVFSWFVRWFVLLCFGLGCGFDLLLCLFCLLVLRFLDFVCCCNILLGFGSCGLLICLGCVFIMFTWVAFWFGYFVLLFVCFWFVVFGGFGFMAYLLLCSCCW